MFRLRKKTPVHRNLITVCYQSDNWKFMSLWLVTSVDDNFLFGDSGKLFMSTNLTGGRSVLSYSTTIWVPEMSISFFLSLRQVSDFFLVASESSNCLRLKSFWFVLRRGQTFSWRQSHQTRLVVALYDDACLQNQLCFCFLFVFVVVGLVGETSDLLYVTVSSCCWDKHCWCYDLWRLMKVKKHGEQWAARMNLVIVSHREIEISFESFYDSFCTGLFLLPRWG